MQGEGHSRCNELAPKGFSDVEKSPETLPILVASSPTKFLKSEPWRNCSFPENSQNPGGAGKSICLRLGVEKCPNCMESVYERPTRGLTGVSRNMNQSTKYRMRIEGMTCSDCEHHVRQALSSVGAVDVEASFKRNEAIFQADRTFSAKEAREAVIRAGYQPLDLHILAESASEPAIYTLEIQGMTCTSCEHHVIEALKTAGALDVQADFQRGLATIVVPENFSWDTARDLIIQAGYQPSKAVRKAPAASGSLTHFSSRKEYDLLIIGSGSAAFAAAIEAARAKARVAMAERGVIGGTCVNVGCVPSKALLRASDLHHWAQSNPVRGLHTKAEAPDLETLVEEKDGLVARLRKEKYEDLMAEYDIDLLTGEARFVDNKRVQVGERIWEAGHYVIATGSAPRIPHISGLESVDYLTSTSALSLTKRPDHLVVIGSGYIGLELGQLFRHWGSEVTLIQRGTEIMPFFDSEVRKVIRRMLEEAGIEVITGASYQHVEAVGGEKAVYLQNQGTQRVVTGDALLVAAGRIPNTSSLNLQAAGVAWGSQGEIAVNENLGTANPYVYAAGDVTMGPQFVYVAAYEGKLAARNALGLTTAPQPLDLSVVPMVIFTQPAIASVGLTEQAARERGLKVISTVLPLDAVTRAVVNRETQGLFKMVADEGSGRVLGVQIVSENAGEVIYAAQLAVKFGLTIHDLTDTLAPYLTMAEGLKLAALTFNQDVSKLSCCAG